MTTKKLNSYSERNFGLDAVRSTAILLVLTAHSIYLLKPMGWNLQFLRFGGFFGVELFFVLSGYLIGTILIKVFESNKKLKIKNLKLFWVRRWLRTLPNYYLILFINLLISILWIPNENFNWKYLFFLQNTFTPHPFFFDEAWSLSVEEWFYMSFPICLFLISLLLKGWSKKKILFLTLTLFILTIPIFRIVVFKMYNPGWDYGFRKIVSLRLDAIVYGVLMAYLMFYRKNLFLKTKHVSFIVSIILTAINIFLYEHFILTDQANNLYFKVFYFSQVSVGLVLIIPWAIQQKPMLPKFVKKTIVSISVTSYSIYLIHYSLLLNILKHNLIPKTKFMTLAVFVIYLFLVFSLSFLLYKYFEYPTMQFRESIARRLKLR